MSSSASRGSGAPGSAGRRPRGEIRRMAQPVLDVLGAIVRRAHWPIALLACLYLASGVTAVKADEVAVVLRFGRLRGASPAERIHRPGLLWALPRPIDEVVRVQVDKIHEVEIDGLWPPPDRLRSAGIDEAGQNVIDPEREGYCLTGDRNIMQFLLLVRYRVLDPVAYALVQVDPHQLLRDVVQAAMVRQTGEISVDDLLTTYRDRLGIDVQRRAQVVLDDLGSGLELVSVELLDFQPPVAVIPAFIEVSTARIEALSKIWEAQQYREEQVPAAEAERDKLLADAKIFTTELLSRTRGQARSFEDLLAEYRAAPEVVRERLWVETVERTLASVTSKKFIPPPVGKRYEDLRITLSTRRP